MDHDKDTNEISEDSMIATTDPWAHRSVGMRCKSCMWYVPKGDARRGFGRCRKHAPTMAGYPAVYDSDWCGDHKLDETKR